MSTKFKVSSFCYAVDTGSSLGLFRHPVVLCRGDSAALDLQDWLTLFSKQQRVG